MQPARASKPRGTGLTNTLAWIAIPAVAAVCANAAALWLSQDAGAQIASVIALASVVGLAAGHLLQARAGRDAPAPAVEPDAAISARTFTQSDMDAALAAHQARFLADITSRINLHVDVLVVDMNITCQSLLLAAEDMSSNARETQTSMVSTSQRLEGATESVGKIAGSITELSQSTRELAEQSSTAAMVVERAREQTRDMRNTLSKLEQAIARIGDMGGLISGIAGKTNLLALNATIEAARAGDAGRGFAVVAQEVKALAGQTSDATGEIASQLAGVRAATREVLEVITSFGSLIEEITHICTTIASATEQQSVMTSTINFNVEETAEDSRAASEVLGDVTSKSIAMTGRTQDLSALAKSLSDQADQIERAMARVVTDLKAA